MAEHDSKSEVVTTEAPELKNRRYTVGYIRDWKTHNRATSITIKGNWLVDAGFETGTPLKVRVMPGCLILTAQEPVVIPPPPPEPEIMQTLRKVTKLTADRQQQITDFIEMIMAKQSSAGKWG